MTPYLCPTYCWFETHGRCFIRLVPSCLMFSAQSWLSQVLVTYMADELKIEPFIPTTNQIQYLNPVHHREFLSCIAEVGRKQTAEELSGALAASVWVDGSVDQ